VTAEDQAQSMTAAVEEDDLGAPSLNAGIEALLMLADEPMPAMALAQATRRPLAEVEQALRLLAADYAEQGRGFDLREVAGGWRFYTRLECAPLVERWVLDGQQARLTQASLETLAVIAYLQPVTRGRVSAVRGVNVDGVIRTLTTRGLITEAGHDGESGAILYRTTSTFLERLGVASLDDLPPIADHLPDLADLDEVLDSVATGE
jgi:segregation and condensation protein B